MVNFQIDRTEFMRHFFEKRPVIFRGAASDEKFEWTDIDEAIYASQSSPLKIKIHSGNGFLSPETYEWKCLEIGVLKSQLNSREIHRQFDSGSTLVFNRMESLSLKVRDICRQISKFLSIDVVANGYLSFGDKGAFGDHWDTHDVFAVQLIGKKSWKIYNPTFSLPIEGQISRDHKHLRPVEPEMDFTLERGDVVYIPRGWWHSATALGEPTFHIAAGVHTQKYLDYVCWVAKNKLASNETLRASLIFGDAESWDVDKIIEDVVREVRNLDNFREYVEQMSSGSIVASDIGVAQYAAKFGSQRAP